jgi:DNA-binding beta-propeller fold protein YncE
VYNGYEGLSGPRKERWAMKGKPKGARVLLLIVVGLVVVALIILYLTAPPPTVLTIRAVDAETGAPLAGAQVQVRPRNGQWLPTIVADENGAARFDSVPPDPSYVVQVQNVDSNFVSQEDVAVPQEQETEVVVPLMPHPGGRLFVGLDRARVLEIDTASWLGVQTLVLSGAPEASVSHLRLHPTEALLYAVVGDKGFILDSRIGAVIGRMKVDTGIGSLDLSADGQYLLLTTVQNGLGASRALGLVHLLALDARSGEVVTDTLLSGDRSLTAAAGMSGTARASTESADTRLPGSGTMPQVLWRPEGGNAYVLDAADETIRGMNTIARSILGVYEVPVGPLPLRETVVLSYDKQYAYTWHRGARPVEGEGVDFLIVISTDDGTMMMEDRATGISALAASPAKQELYILNSVLDTMTILDLTGQRAQTVVAVGRKPDLLAIDRDGEWAYVANRDSHTVSVVHLPSAQVAYTIPLPGEPGSLAVR